MKLSLNGIEIEIPGDAQVDVSEDGKRVTIKTAEPKVVETIRLVEVPAETNRFIPGPETIRIVEVEKPCTRPHYDHWITYPYTWPYTNPYPWTSGIQTITTTTEPNQSWTISGLADGNGGLSNNNISTVQYNGCVGTANSLVSNNISIT